MSLFSQPIGYCQDLPQAGYISQASSQQEESSSPSSSESGTSEQASEASSGLRAHRRYKASLCRFKNWIAYTRYLSPKLNEEQKCTCPMVACQLQCNSWRMLLQHIQDCQDFSDGSYLCFDDGREVRIGKCDSEGCRELKGRFASAVNSSLRSLTRRFSERKPKVSQVGESSLEPTSQPLLSSQQCFETAELPVNQHFLYEMTSTPEPSELYAPHDQTRQESCAVDPTQLESYSNQSEYPKYIHDYSDVTYEASGRQSLAIQRARNSYAESQCEQTTPGPITSNANMYLPTESTLVQPSPADLPAISPVPLVRTVARRGNVRRKPVLRQSLTDMETSRLSHATTTPVELASQIRPSAKPSSHPSFVRDSSKRFGSQPVTNNQQDLYTPPASQPGLTTPQSTVDSYLTTHASDFSGGSGAHYPSQWSSMTSNDSSSEDESLNHSLTSIFGTDAVMCDEPESVDVSFSMYGYQHRFSNPYGREVDLMGVSFDNYESTIVPTEPLSAPSPHNGAFNASYTSTWSNGTAPTNTNNGYVMPGCYFTNGVSEEQSSYQNVNPPPYLEGYVNPGRQFTSGEYAESQSCSQVTNPPPYQMSDGSSLYQPSTPPPPSDVPSPAHTFEISSPNPTTTSSSSRTPHKVPCGHCDKPIDSSNLARHTRDCKFNPNPCPRLFRCPFPGCKSKSSRDDNLKAHQRRAGHLPMTDETELQLSTNAMPDSPIWGMVSDALRQGARPKHARRFRR